MKLVGKVAIITGAGTGLGAALARQMAAGGARVVLAGRRTEKLEATASQIGDPDRVLVVQADVTRHAQLEHLVRVTVAEFGRVDILVNNAGIGMGGHLSDLKPEEISYIVTLNLIAPIWLIRVALPHLRESPQSSIINISSMAALVAVPGQSVYAASKAGMVSLGECLRRELVATNVRVMTVFPGTLDTEMLSQGNNLEEPDELGLGQSAMPADEAARSIMKGLLAGKSRLFVVSRRERMLRVLNRWFPWILDRIFVKLWPALYKFMLATNEFTRTRHHPRPLSADDKEGGQAVDAVADGDRGARRELDAD